MIKGNSRLEHAQKKIVWCFESQEDFLAKQTCRRGRGGALTTVTRWKTRRPVQASVECVVIGQKHHYTTWQSSFNTEQWHRLRFRSPYCFWVFLSSWLFSHRLLTLSLGVMSGTTLRKFIFHRASAYTGVNEPLIPFSQACSFCQVLQRAQKEDDTNQSDNLFSISLSFFILIRRCNF